MRMLLYSSVVLSFVLVGCQKNEEVEAERSKSASGSIAAEGIFTEQDGGESIKLSRQSRSSARQAVDTYSIPGTTYGGYDSYNYGYGYHNPFLAFADYVHWLDYRVTSVVKLQFGRNPDIIHIAQAAPVCWNFTITSTNTLTVQRIDQRSTSGYGSMSETGQNQISVQWVVESGRGGLIFALHGPASYSTGGYYDYGGYGNPNWYQTSSDPYQYGYDGYYGDSYYYYPVNPQSLTRAAATLRVAGTAGPCTGTTTGQYFDVDLSTELNNYPGYMPSIRKSVAGSELLSGRIVNFNGQDWWY